MACLDMYNQNSEHPRISFSNDFAESSTHDQMMIKNERASREAPPVSSDFEFSVTNYSMMSADELFFKGRLLPFKDDSCNNNQYQKITTLRDELLVVDDDDVSMMRPPKGSSTRWKELLGLKKTHIASKKSAKNDAYVERRPGLVHDHETHVISKTSEEMLNDGGHRCGV